VQIPRLCGTKALFSCYNMLILYSPFLYSPPSRTHTQTLPIPVFPFPLPVQFIDQFLQISTSLPTNYNIYGLGEHVTQLRLQ